MYYISGKNSTLLILIFALSNLSAYSQKQNFFTKAVSTYKYAIADNAKTINENKDKLLVSNPSDGFLNIKDNSYNSSTKKAYIVNDQGKVLWSEQNFYKEALVDVRQLRRGTYYVKLFSRENIYSVPFQKK